MTTHLQNYVETESGFGYSIKIDDLEKNKDKVRVEWTFDDATIESLIKLGFSRGCSPAQFCYHPTDLEVEVWLYAEEKNRYQMNVKFWITNETTQEELKENHNKIQQFLKELNKIIC